MHIKYQNITFSQATRENRSKDMRHPRCGHSCHLACARPVVWTVHISISNEMQLFWLTWVACRGSLLLDLTVPRALLVKVTNMSIVMHFDNESCRPQSISLYNGATVLTSAASHAEIKAHYRLDVTSKGWCTCCRPCAKTAENNYFRSVNRIFKSWQILLLGWWCILNN